jgi:hypothetical protein
LEVTGTGKKREKAENIEGKNKNKRENIIPRGELVDLIQTTSGGCSGSKKKRGGRRSRCKKSKTREYE